MYIFNIKKNKINKILLSLLTLFLITGCEKFKDVAGSDWEYSETIDKISGEKTITSEKRFEEKDAPLVLVDMKMQCETKSKTLSATITTYDSHEKDGRLNPMPMTLEKNLFPPTNIIETRSGQSQFNVLASQDKYNNVVAIFLSDAIYGGIFPTPSLADKFMTKEWIIRVPTQQGTPTITIDMSDSNIHKVYEACDWTPQYLSSSNTKTVAPLPASAEATKAPEVNEVPAAETPASTE
jgi:hypothetical protein